MSSFLLELAADKYPEGRLLLHKYLVIGIAVLTLALVTPSAQAQGEGIIEAQVVNGTEDGGSVEGLTVTLDAFRGGTEELDSLTAMADTEGQVRFEGVDTSPDITYLLTATYADVTYHSLPLNFEETGETSLDAAIEVYETTEALDEAGIRVERMHVFVDFEGGEMSVGELHIFANTSDRTLVGVTDPELGQRVTLRFTLPEGATGLRFNMGGEGDRFLITEDGFADTEVVRPGTSQQVLYGYALRYGETDAFDFVRPLLYPTTHLNVLVPRVGLDVTSDQVELSEISTVEGQVYLNLNGTDFAAGDELSVRFSGLQDLARQPATPATAQDGLDPKWIALGLAAVALVGGVIYPSLRRSAKPASAGLPVESTDERLTHLLQAMAELDDTFEAGDVGEASYRKQRQTLKSEVLTLMRES
jgi:hypothetical protein